MRRRATKSKLIQQIQLTKHGKNNKKYYNIYKMSIQIVVRKKVTKE